MFLIGLLTSSSSQKIIIFLLLGLTLIGFGMLASKTNLILSGDKVEVLNSTTEPQNIVSEITVEIAGAVEKPGVYKFPKTSRVDDLLIVSGGLSKDADRNWVDKNINRAAKLNDGQKIYIYSQSDIESAKDNSGIKIDQSVLGDKTNNNENLVNINTSSQSELEKLKGIGPVYATKIIEHRPYSVKEELVSKGAISQKVFEKISNDISL